jgi:hypothetical protein
VSEFFKYPSRNGIVIPAARQYRPFTVRGDGLNDPGHYESSVLGMLRSFDAIQTTRALMNGFRALGRDVLVVPYDFSVGSCNAVSRSEWGLFPNKVYYSPNLYYPGPDCECIDPGDAGNSAHEVLCHELVHALRRAAGTIHRYTKKGEEETLAIMVTNIFASETNKPALRKNHHNHAPQKDPVLNTSEGYLAANRNLVALFAREHGAVASALSYVNARFNPIRAYFHEALLIQKAFTNRNFSPM